VIVTPGVLDAPAQRLLDALGPRGERVVDAAAVPAGTEPVTLAVSTGAFVFDFAGLVRAVAPRPFRVVILSRLGAHPDAKAESLRRLWRMEEHVRGGGAPTLTLRFAPLVGPASPFWRLLCGGPSLPRGGRQLVCPVAESDAVETLARALGLAQPVLGDAAFRDWYEVAGPDAMTLAELRELAVGTGGPRSGQVGTGGSRAGGAWEPSQEEIAEHRLAESEPWASRFGITPARIATEAAAWAA
jgi:uncharacterized protein YbjT (DUF2867 family)